MRKISDIKTDTYQFSENYFIDIVTSNDGYDAFLYNKNYGIKVFMFGCPRYYQTYDEFLGMVYVNATDYIYEYETEYLDN